MSDELILLNSKTLVFHCKATVDLTDPERRITAAVKHYKHGALVVRSLLPRDWNYLAKLRGEERTKMLWFPLMEKAMRWSSVIDGVLEYGASHGWTEAVFHGGHLDSVHERVGTDDKGYPLWEMRAAVPRDLTLLLSEENKPWDTSIQEVRYERERLPREDAMWHYHMR